MTHLSVAADRLLRCADDRSNGPRRESGLGQRSMRSIQRVAERPRYSAIQCGKDDHEARAYACAWLEIPDDELEALERPTQAVIETLRKQLTRTPDTQEETA